MQDRSWTAEAKQQQQKRKSNLGGEPTSSARQFRRVDLRAICVMPSTSTLQEENGTVAPNKSTVERKPPVRNGRGWETSNPRIDSESYHACTRPQVGFAPRTNDEPPHFLRTTVRRVLSVRRSAAAVARRWCLKTPPSSVVLALPGVFASDEIEDGRRRPGTTGPPALAFSTDTCH